MGVSGEGAGLEEPAIEEDAPGDGAGVQGVEEGEVVGGDGFGLAVVEGEGFFTQAGSAHAGG